MSRILDGFAFKFGRLFRVIGARRPGKAFQIAARQAGELRKIHSLPLDQALASVYLQYNLRVAATNFGRRRVAAYFPREPRFICDAGLGGLARWLRAAGYPAEWLADCSDDHLLRVAEKEAGVIVTTDSPLLERRKLRDERLFAVWVPPSVPLETQLELTLSELGLSFRDSRCMRCGGELCEVSKEEMRHRIPPKTFLWLDEYYLCSNCGQLFWHGTHWKRVQARLAKSPLRQDTGSSS